MLPLAHGALGYLDELLPFFLIAGFAIILIVVAFLSRKTEHTLIHRENEASQDGKDAVILPQSSEAPDATDHFRLD